MGIRRNQVLVIVLLALGWGGIAPVRAFEWPLRWQRPVCSGCCQPIARAWLPGNRVCCQGLDYHPACTPPVVYRYDEPLPPAVPVTAPPEPAPEQSSPLAGSTPQANAAESAQTPGASESASGALSAAENAAPPALSSGTGGGMGAPQGALNMFGDLSPFSGFRPPAPPEPPGSQPSGLGHSAIFNPTIRSFKIADNQTAMPVDRFSFAFNYFDYVNQSVNERFGVPIDRIRAYRYIFGVEKMFLDGRASVGMRLPLNNLVGNSNVPGLGNSSTALGDLSVYFKYALWIDRDWGRVLTGGMAVTMPTGPSSFGGADWVRGIHYTNLQPFLAFQYTWDRVYTIGFASVDVPTSQRDVLMLYQDLGLGYYIYRNKDPDSKGLIKAVAPTFEVHVNSPSNHRDVFNARDIAGTAEVVDLTSGLNVFFGQRTLLSVGVVDPVTGPRPFSLEALALLNVFY